jgi:histidinol-phosphate aminotransferase
MDKKIKINKPISLEHSSLKYPLPEELLFEIAQELGNIKEYPTGGNYPELTAKFAGYAGVQPYNVLPANGSDEVIEAVTRAFGDKLILIPVPTFSQYEVSAIRNGFKKKLINCLNGYDYKLNYNDDDLKNASLVWICNPNNPTAGAISREAITGILDRVPGIVVVDECNYEYLGETVADLIDKYPNLVISRSFSKNFGLAGLRLGFTIASSNNIEKISRYYQYFRVNKVAEIAGVRVLKYIDYYQAIWQEIARVRDLFIQGLHQLNIKVFPSQTNFVLVDFITHEMTKNVWQYLREQGIFTFAAWGDEFSGLENHYIRFTVGNEQEMEYTLNILQEYQDTI